MAVVVLALVAAASWGVSDFLGGLAARRVPVALVTALVEGGGLVVALVLTLAGGEQFFSSAAAVQAAGAGISGVVGLACFYRALAIGTMSIVAPISATGVALPVLVGLITGDRPSVAQGFGLVAIVAGVVLASREQQAEGRVAGDGRAAVGLALLAAVGFGGFFALADAPSDGSVLWMVVVARGAALPVVLAAIAVTRPPLPGGRLALGIAAIGTIDLFATALIGVANTQGQLSVVSVLGGMYPVVTVLLAALVLHERLRASQLVGVGLALGGVALVAAG